MFNRVKKEYITYPIIFVSVCIILLVLDNLGFGVPKCKPYDKSMTGHENEARVNKCLEEEQGLKEERAVLEEKQTEISRKASEMRAMLRTEETAYQQEIETSERPDVKLQRGMVGNRED